MKYINHIQRTAILLVLLLAGWAAGVPLSAQTVVEVIPDPATNLAGTDNGSNMQPLDSLMVADYGITFRFYSGSSRTAPAYYANGLAIRLYNGNTFSVHSDGTYTIDMIEFPSSYSSSNESTLLYEVGALGYDAETNTYIWFNEGGVSDAGFAIQETQLRLPSIRLTLTANGETAVRPKAPVLSQKSCDFYAPFELTINDMNDPAATVRYTLDGSEPSADNGETYTGPFTIPAGADVTVKAVAVNDNGVSAVTSATYHFVPKHLLTLRLPNKGGVSYVYYSSSNEYGEWQGKDGSAYITEGDQVSIGYYLNSGYSCKSIMLDGERLPVADDWFTFTMPSKDVELVIETMFNPSSPGDPQPGDTTRTYDLKLVINPNGAGYVSSGSGRYAAGTSVYVSAYNSTGYVFTGWTKDGETISTSSSMNYTMPASDVALTANYVFNPSSPKDPDQPALKHPLTAVASPAGSASFNLSASEVTFGENYYVYVYPNDGYRLKGWIVNGVAQESTTSPLTGTMTDAGAHVVALMVFDPSSPSNPGANYYNPTTGQVIIDDFQSDYLYSALRQTVGSSGYENVSSIIVKGQMTYSDYNCLSYLTNATTIDVSRTGGSTELPGYTFQNLGVANVAVSSTITEFGSYVFSGCANLSSLTVYAQEPPRCSSSTFSGFTNKTNCTVYVPASAIELYSNADYWKDFTILPITNDAHVMQVNLPQDAADGRYKHNSLEIVNINTGVRQKYVISDRLLYTFNGLQKDEQYNIYMYSQAGLEIGRIENVVIPDHDFEVTFDSLKALYNVEAKVLASDGSDVTSQVTVEWLKPLADGTVTYLRKAVSLGEVPEGQQLICRVTLDSKLGVVYAAPGDAEFTVSDGDNTFTVTLTPFRSIALSGKVTDGDGAVLQGASVSVNQTLNGKYTRTFTAKTDGSGLWNLSVLDAPETRVTYAAAECVNLTDTIGAFDAGISALDLGQKALRSIVGARVTYGFTYRAAGAEEAEQHYADYQNVAVSVYNVTQDRAHSDLSLQYPVLAVLDENISTGDELRLTAMSKTGAFNPIERTVTVGDNQRAEVTFDIVGKGGIAASFEMTDNPAVTAMLYSAKGELLKKMTYTEAKATFAELEDGEYTLVSMGRSDLMNSILRLSNFGEIGLTEGKDYVKNTVTVETGKLAEIKIGEVPAFDESLFYYTTSMTGFSSNKSSITTGNYLTLRSAIDFKGVYKNDISNVALVVDLPEACDLVDQSVIQGPNLLPYTLDGKRLTVQLGNNYASQTRFCVIPTSGGTFNATASIVFDYNGKTLTQPIGTATSEIKDIEISVPSVIAGSTFKVTGYALGNSTVNVYEDGTLLGSGKANAAGTWNVECELVNPYNLSKHSIYAEITTPAGNALTSETKELTYDVNALQVSKVTMYHWNPELNGGNGRMEVSEFDFLNPKTTATQWTVYYPKKVFTYTIEFTANDPERISNVILYVHTADSKIVPVNASYDEKKGMWYAEIDMGNSSNGYYPVNCSVDFDFTAPLQVDKEMLDEAYDTDLDLATDVAQNISALDKFLNDIDSFTGSNEELLALSNAFDEQIGFSYTTPINDEEIEAEVARIRAMSDEEKATYMAEFGSHSESEYNKVIDDEFMKSFDGLYGSSTIVVDGIEYIITRSDASSFDEATAEESGYNKVTTDDFCFYTRVSDTPMSVEMVDKSRNLYIKLVPTSESAVTLKAAKSGSDATDIMFEAAIEALENASEMLSKAVNLVMDLVDWAGELVEVLAKGLDKDIRIAEVAAKYAFEQGVIDGEMSSYHDWTKRAANLKTKKANLYKWLDKVKGFKATTFTKKANLLLNVKSLITDVRNWWSLYRKIKGKIPCEAAPTRAEQLLSDVKYYGGLVCTLDVLNLTSSCMALYSAVVAVAGSAETAGSSLVIGGAAALTLQGVSIVAGLVGDYMSNRMYKQLKSDVDKLKCRTDCGQSGQPKCPEDDPKNGPGASGSGSSDDNVQIDPSGFVYEAVPENRVEGVQASIYYKETKEDMYGDPYEEIVLWDAEEYAQKNPLFTDENGMYRWDVPQGLWQVKFEKDGYVTAYSEWLPVPPPQLDVNVAITQNKQPEVTEARAYEEGVEVQFDKYMDLSTLTTDNIYVTAAGEKLGGEIRMVDSALADEYASEDDADATRYASRIRFVPEEPLSATTGEVRVTVSRNVLSYAGIPMTETFSQVLDVEKEVQMIVADDMKVLYGGEKELTVYALPYDAAVGRTLRIANSSDLIASVDITEAVLDDEGKAVVTVRGELPGSAQLSFTIDDVTATGACAVDVLTEIITAEMPKASRASGTAVYRGTKIELTTESKDATIYFTTDGSCPCDENGTRRKYTVPVVIDGDMRILAVTSVGNGNDDISETAEFNYTLKRSDMDFRMDEGWTWMSHNFESAVAAAALAADENVSRILSQTQEVVRDPELGMTGTLTALSAQESYKVETTAPTGRVRMSDVALNPATPISLTAGWNWLGYPVDQTMSVDEAFANTEVETLDFIVGQNGFAQYDGEKWTGTLETMSPGMGYMYQSRSAKDVVYNTSIVSTASAKYTPGISTGLPFVLDIHKYASVMPVVASLTAADGAALDCADYQVAAFCGTECRGIGRTVDGMVMMNVYGNAGDRITFTVADIDGERFFDNSASLKFSEDIVGDVFTPYDITLNDLSGMAGVTYDGNIRVTVDGDILRINGIAPDDIDFVEIYDMDGRKLLRATGITDSGVTVRGMISGVYIVIVNASGEYSYHKIALR